MAGQYERLAASSRLSWCLLGQPRCCLGTFVCQPSSALWSSIRFRPGRVLVRPRLLSSRLPRWLADLGWECSLSRVRHYGPASLLGPCTKARGSWWREAELADQGSTSRAVRPAKIGRAHV